MGERIGKNGEYIQAAWTQMKQDFDLPDVFYLDMWPVGPEFIVFAGPDAVALPTQTTAFPQAELVADYFAGTALGRNFIECTNGPLWKELHQMLAPGLTPTATKMYHHIILDEAKSLHDRFRRLAVSEAVADMNFQLGLYPFSIIWQVFFGEPANLGSGLYDDAKRWGEIAGAMRTVVNPITKWQERREMAAISKRLGAEIDRITRARFSKLQRLKSLPTRANASCLLDRMLLNQVQAGLPLDDRLMSLIQDK